MLVYHSMYCTHLRFAAPFFVWDILKASLQNPGWFSTSIGILNVELHFSVQLPSKSFLQWFWTPYCFQAQFYSAFHFSILFSWIMSTLPLILMNQNLSVCSNEQLNQNVFVGEFICSYLSPKSFLDRQLFIRELWNRSEARHCRAKTLSTRWGFSEDDIPDLGQEKNNFWLMNIGTVHVFLVLACCNCDGIISPERCTCIL